jgi:hypothetical protein
MNHWPVCANGWEQADDHVLSVSFVKEGDGMLRGR